MRWSLIAPSSSMVPVLKASRSAVIVRSLPCALNSLSTIAEMALY